MANRNIVFLAQSKYDFYVDRYYTDGAWVLRHGPIRLADYHANLLAHIFQSDAAGRLPYDTGARFSLALLDELGGYVHTDTKRLWTEFKTDPTRLNSLKFVVGYAGYTGQFELWESLLTTRLKGEPVPELADITNNGDPACCANGRKFAFWSHVCLKWGDFLDLSFLASTSTHAKHCTLDIATK